MADNTKHASRDTLHNTDNDNADIRKIMIDSLFPAEHELMTLKQGGLGDCFVLAGLYAICSCKGGIEKLKSCFRVAQNGEDIEVVIPKKMGYELSPDAKKQAESSAGDRSPYRIREEKNNYVFTVTPEKSIDMGKKAKEAKIGCGTNCPAILIMEHILGIFVADLPFSTSALLPPN